MTTLLDRDPTTITDPRERLIYLRDFLAKKCPPEKFEMAITGDPEDAGTSQCNSPACIGGWARAFWGRPLMDIEWVGTSELGLDEETSWDLMYPGFDHKCPPYSATALQAARVLTHLIETGEVDWSVAFKEDPS